MAYNYSQIMMTLAAITYAEPTDIGLFLLPSTKPVNATQGNWALVWGPALTPDGGNLMFIASNATTAEYAVVIRGTYPHFGLALLIDLYEDLDVRTQKPWTYPTTANAWVTGGIFDGFNDLLGLTFNGVKFQDFMSKAGESGNTVYVTGYSLGGALATVIAPWITDMFSQSQSKSVVIPYTFAAPTAGNTPFSAFYSALYPNALRYYNTLDIIPTAWADLLAIQALYPSPGPACPWEVKDIIAIFQKWLAAIGNFSQPNGGGQSLPGQAAGDSDFFTEALDQHDHNCYLSLLNAPCIPIPPPGAPAGSVAAKRAASAAIFEEMIPASSVNSRRSSE